MKKLRLLTLAIVLLIFSGCGGPELVEDIVVPTEYLFVGENESWRGDYRVTGFRTFDGEDPSQFSGDYEYILTVVYKGKPEDLYDVEKLEIRSKGELKDIIYRDTFLRTQNMEPTYTIKSRSRSLEVLEDETIHITITMDDKIEKLELTSK
jgi:hypothetical protein